MPTGRTWGAAHYPLFPPLLEVSRRQPGRCELFQWLATLDTSVWLRGHDLAYLHADGCGVRLEDGRALRFLVHVDPGPLGTAIAEYERHTSGLDALLAGYRRTDPAVPVGAILVITDTPEREEHLLADLVERPVRAPIATASKDLLYRYWPNESLWRVPEAAATAAADRSRALNRVLPSAGPVGGRKPDPAYLPNMRADTPTMWRRRSSLRSRSRITRCRSASAGGTEMNVRWGGSA